jgi:hypothetical protein
VHDHLRVGLTDDQESASALAERLTALRRALP